MKKIFALMALVLGMVSCQNDFDGANVSVDGEQEVTINVAIPEAETRAAAGTDSAKGLFENGVLTPENVTLRYIMQVYDAAGNASKERQVAYSDGTSVAFKVRLVPERHYNFVVWADVVTKEATATEFTDVDNHYITKDEDGKSNLNNITLNPNSEWTAMDETRDAFTGYFNTEEIDANKPYSGSLPINITLTRPFAKLRVVTTDMEALGNLDIVPTTATVKYVEVSKAFNAYNGKAAAATEAKEHTYAIATYGDNVENKSMVLFTDYLFANDDIVKFEFEVFDQKNQSIKYNNFNTDIPVKRNFLTTIKGNVLTDGNNIKVDVSDDFENGQNPNNPPYYQVAVSTGFELVKALYEGREIIVINDITVTAADVDAYLATTRAGNAINPVLNLNGFTITIENNEAEALVNLNGGALKVEGEGAIKSTAGALVETIYNTGEATIAETAATVPVVNCLAEIRAAFANGGTYTMVCDFAISESLTLAAGKELVLNLNDKTLTGYDKGTASFGLITNNGNLTVKDGTITLKAENNRGWNAYSSVISNSVGGNLVVENVTLEHLGGTDMAYGIDNLTNGKGTSAITNINNGAVVKSTYRAVRQFLNGIEATNELYVNAGAVVEGANKSIWMQDPSANANTGKLVVNEGATLNGDVYLFVCAGSTEWPVEVSIANAAFAEGSTVVTGNVPADYKVVEKDGVWTVVPNFNDNFAENTWENIIKACQNNCVPETWHVGDTKAMTIAGKDYQIRILGKNHDTYTAGGTAPLTFQIAEVYGAAPMNATQTNTTGWSGSKMRTETMAEILEVMPVKDAIKAVNKETLNGTRDGLETTSDKLFLLSEVEVNGSVYFSNNFAEGSRYAFFGDVDSMKSNASYWLRGPGKNNAIGYTQINMSGYMANGSAEYACGVVFGFCF